MVVKRIFGLLSPAPGLKKHMITSLLATKEGRPKGGPLSNWAFS